MYNSVLHVFLKNGRGTDNYWGITPETWRNIRHTMNDGEKDRVVFRNPRTGKLVTYYKDQVRDMRYNDGRKPR